MVDLDKNIDIADVTPNSRVALRNDSYTLHKILPSKVNITNCYPVRGKNHKMHIILYIKVNII